MGDQWMDPSLVEMVATTTHVDNIRDMQPSPVVNKILEQVQHLSETDLLMLYIRLPTAAGMYAQPCNNSTMDKQSGDCGMTLLGNHSLTSPIADLRKLPCNPLGTRSEIQLTKTWIRTHLQLDKDVSMPKQQVFEEYKEFCSAKDCKPLSTADFGKVMKQVFVDVKPRRLGKRGSSKYCYSGLRKSYNLEQPSVLDVFEPKPSDKVWSSLSTPQPMKLLCVSDKSTRVVLDWAEKMLNGDFGRQDAYDITGINNHALVTSASSRKNAKFTNAIKVKQEKLFFATCMDLAIYILKREMVNCNTEHALFLMNTLGVEKMGKHKEISRQLQKKLNDKKKPNGMSVLVPMMTNDTAESMDPHKQLCCSKAYQRQSSAPCSRNPSGDSAVSSLSSDCSAITGGQDTMPHFTSLPSDGSAVDNFFNSGDMKPTVSELEPVSHNPASIAGLVINNMGSAMINPNCAQTNYMAEQCHKDAPQLSQALTKPLHGPAGPMSSKINYAAFAHNKIKSEKCLTDEFRMVENKERQVACSPMSISPTFGASGYKYANSHCGVNGNFTNVGRSEYCPKTSSSWQNKCDGSAMVAAGNGFNGQSIVANGNKMKFGNNGTLLSPSETEEHASNLEHGFNEKFHVNKPAVHNVNLNQARQFMPIQPGSILRCSDVPQADANKCMYPSMPQHHNTDGVNSNYTSPFTSPQCTPMVDRSRNNSGQHPMNGFTPGSYNHAHVSRRVSLNDDGDLSNGMSVAAFMSPVSTPAYDRSRHSSQHHLPSQSHAGSGSALPRSRHPSAGGARASSYQPYIIKDHGNNGNLVRKRSRVQSGGIILSPNNGGNNTHVVGLSAAGPYSAPQSPHVDSLEAGYAQQHSIGAPPPLKLMNPQDIRRRHTSAGCGNSGLIHPSRVLPAPSVSRFQSPTSQAPSAHRTLLSLLSDTSMPSLQCSPQMAQNPPPIQQQPGNIESMEHRPQSVPLPDIGSNPSYSLSVPTTPLMHHNQHQPQQDLQNYIISSCGTSNQFSFDQDNSLVSSESLEKTHISSNPIYSSACPTSTFPRDTINEELGDTITEVFDTVSQQMNMQQSIEDGSNDTQQLCMQALGNNFKDNVQIAHETAQCNPRAEALPPTYVSDDSEVENCNPFNCLPNNRNVWLANGRNKEAKVPFPNNMSSGNVMFSPSTINMRMHEDTDSLNVLNANRDSHLADTPSSMPPSQLLSLNNGSDIQEDYSLRDVFGDDFGLSMEENA